MYGDSQDRIDSYLRGDMSPTERKRFELEIKSDLDLYKDFLETKAIANVIADRGKKLAMMNRWKDEEKALRRKHIRNCTIGMGAAACLLFGCFLLKPLIFPSITHNSIEMPLFSHEVNSYGENTGLEVLDLMINSKDYSNALAFADILINENKQRIEQKSQNNMSNKVFDIVKYGNLDSVASLNSDKILRYEEIVYEVEWRQINLLLALNKKDECIKALNKFINKDGIYKTEACSLLKTLSETTNINK